LVITILRSPFRRLDIRLLERAAGACYLTALFTLAPRTATCGLLNPTCREHRSVPPHQSPGTPAWQSSQPVEIQAAPDIGIHPSKPGPQVRILPGAPPRFARWLRPAVFRHIASRPLARCEWARILRGAPPRFGSFRSHGYLKHRLCEIDGDGRMLHADSSLRWPSRGRTPLAR